VPDGSLFTAVQSSTRAEKGVYINNYAGHCESGRDVAEALDFRGDCFLEFFYFVVSGDGIRSGTHSPVTSSVNCVISNISGGVWNWSVVSIQNGASKNNPLSL
jgi:hypothetical protein